MASVSVVGQQPGRHRLDSEPPMLFLKLSSDTKTRVAQRRKSSWEKVVFARSREDLGSVSAAAEVCHPLSPGAAGGTPVRGGMPGEGCGAPAAPVDAPRSPTQEEDGGGVLTGSVQGQAGHVSSGYSTPHEAEQNAGGRRRSSLNESGVDGMPSVSRRRHRHREPRRARRSSRSGDEGPHSVSSAAVGAPEESDGLPLERLTQGRTGVVKLARTEPHRIEAWSIFPQVMDPRVRTERGEGHRFETQPVTQDWCDVCSREISAQVIKCQSKSGTNLSRF